MHIPALYHPTQIILLDDDAEFVNSLALALADEFKCQSFTSAQLAQQFLLNNHTWQNALKSQYMQMSTEEWSKFSVDIALYHIYQEIFNPLRFKRVAILVVDYDMPNLNGLEVARALKAKLPIKIILLTGEADQNTAITAFNHKEIDRFLPKNHPEYHTQLIRYINELQQDYFADLSHALIEPLILQAGHPLQDNRYYDLFQTIHQKHQIIEHYLLDASGSFLMLNTKGAPTWLIIRTLADMELFHDMASIERKVPKKILSALAEKAKLICLPLDCRVIPPFKDWVIHNAAQLADREIYYCVVKGWHHNNSPIQPILSYESYLDEG